MFKNIYQLINAFIRDVALVVATQLLGYVIRSKEAEEAAASA
tara:strand:+ start:1448 stop:1573 length:126 start_codon:yes stop_codon:yes gene_type:complete